MTGNSMNRVYPKQDYFDRNLFGKGYLNDSYSKYIIIINI